MTVETADEVLSWDLGAREEALFLIGNEDSRDFEILVGDRRRVVTWSVFQKSIQEEKVFL